ncbi:MAG: hypothetical protein GXY55_00260 [Phycisphaerae bacterium]|nr:hypothetical protein [Phycisphaerae bacterium]
MKPNLPLPAMIAAALVLVGLVLAVFTAGPLENPQDRLFRQIDEKVALAQRMLAGYNPANSRLTAVLGSEGLEPPEGADGNWQTYVSSGEQEGVMSDALRRQAGQMRTLADRFGALDGQTPAAAGAWLASSGQAYQQLQAELKRNMSLLSDALRVLQEAIAMSDGEVSGSDHPAATRLEAALCYHQADLLRREAALQRAMADEARFQVITDARQWQELGNRIQSASRGLAEAGSADGEPSAPAFAERIASLRTRREAVAAAIEEARAEAQRLSAIIPDITARAKAADAQTRQSQVEMLALKEAGIDTSDPAALDRFIQAYNAAAQAEREAFREATTLEHGALRNARVDTNDDEQISEAPIVAIDPATDIKPERGRIALESDLAAVEALAEALQVAAHEIDRQIEELTAKQDGARQRAANLASRQTAIAEDAAGAARIALAAAIEAHRLEDEALALADGRGQQAASRARRAAEKRINDARTQNAENNPDAPNPRLTMITGDANLTGSAMALAGDMAYVIAATQAQRGDDLARHEAMLREMQSMAMEVNASLLPEGVALDQVPAALAQADAARLGIQEAHKAAVEAAKLALEAYQQADSPLRQLWVLHTQMASVHYLLANLSTGNEAADHRDRALQQYKRALTGREERPEYPIYQNVMADLQD